MQEGMGGLYSTLYSLLSDISHKSLAFTLDYLHYCHNSCFFLMDNILRYEPIGKYLFRVTMQGEDGGIYEIDPSSLKEDEKDKHEKYLCATSAANNFDERGRIIPI
jgi:hypothetical protein